MQLLQQSLLTDKNIQDSLFSPQHKMYLQHKNNVLCFPCRKMVTRSLIFRRPTFRPAPSQWAVPTAAEERRISFPTRPSLPSIISEP